MRRIVRLLFALFALLAISLSQSGARADDTCTGPCIRVSGVVTDPYHNPLANYGVWANHKGTWVKTATDADGRYTLDLTQSGTDPCWQIVGRATDYLTSSGMPGVVCASTSTADLHPQFRVTASAPSSREQYVADWRTPRPLTITVFAYSPVYPAPFANAPLDWRLTDHIPSERATRPALQGLFGSPRVTPGDHGFTYEWTTTVTPKIEQPEMLHIDYAKATTVFNAMMDCKMIWYGFGIEDVTPVQTPGQVATITGTALGSARGQIKLLAIGYMATVRDEQILEWTDTKIRFIVPADAQNAYIRVIRTTGISPWCMGGTLGATTNYGTLAVAASTEKAHSLPVLASLYPKR